MDDFGWHQKWVMCVGDLKGKFLDQVIEEHRPKSVLEIGCYLGYSAIRMARLLPEDGKVTSVELSAEYADIARQIINKAGLQNKVDIKVGAASQVIPFLPAPFDMVYIDHDKDYYHSDLLVAETKMRKGTVVVADNVVIFGNNPSIVRYLQRVRDSNVYSSSVLRKSTVEYSKTEEDGVEISIFRAPVEQSMELSFSLRERKTLTTRAPKINTTTKATVSGTTTTTGMSHSSPSSSFSALSSSSSPLNKTVKSVCDVFFELEREAKRKKKSLPGSYRTDFAAGTVPTNEKVRLDRSSTCK
ncbi:Catechol O-methyltransferase [Balamuthia mandrillaris]